MWSLGNVNYLESLSSLTAEQIFNTFIGHNETLNTGNRKMLWPTKRQDKLPLFIFKFAIDD